MKRLSAIVLLYALLFPIAAPTTMALGSNRFEPVVQDPSTPAPAPTPTPDTVLEQAQRDAKLAEELKKKAVADKERIEAENAKLKAIVQPLGAPANVSVPTGSVTTDAAGWVEAQMLAQEAGRQITSDLAHFLCNEDLVPRKPAIKKDEDDKPVGPKIKTLVIYSNNDLIGVELYGAVIAQLKVLKDELEAMNARAEQAKIASDPKTGTGVFTVSRADDADKMVDMPPAAALLAAPGVATGIIKSVAELVNLFRSDTTFSNKAITLSEDLIVSYIAENFGSSSDGLGHNCEGPIKIYYPSLYPPMLLSDSSTSAVITLFNEVEQEKNQAAIHIEALEARIKELAKLRGMFDDLEKKQKEKAAKEKELAADNLCKRRVKPPKCKKLAEEIAELTKATGKLQEDLRTATGKGPAQFTAWIGNFKGWSEQLSDLKTKMQSLVNATNVIAAKLNTPDESTKLTALAQLLRAERLYGIMKDPNTYTLRVAVKANGTTKVKKNLFVDAKVRHSAGADLVYQLFDGDGFIAQANGLQCYIEYQSSSEVQGIVSGTNNHVRCNSNSDARQVHHKVDKKKNKAGSAEKNGGKQ